MRDRIRRDRDSGGFTLIELLITIVIIGILAAVVVLAIGGLTGSGNKSVCAATKDAAEAASVAYYSDHSLAGDASPWPVDFAELIPNPVDPANPPYMDARDGVVAGTTLSKTGGWTLTLVANGGAQPTFSCT